MHFVYFLKSLSKSGKTYVGMTEDVQARVITHNAGGCSSTRRFRPWELIAYVAVQSRSQATELERYFKTGSGHAFWHKRFITRAPSAHMKHEATDGKTGARSSGQSARSCS